MADTGSMGEEAAVGRGTAKVEREGEKCCGFLFPPTFPLAKPNREQWIIKPGNCSLQNQHPWEETVQLQFNCSFVSGSLWIHGLQCARPPCPLPTPGVYSNPCPFSKWCHPTISSSVISFSSHLQSFPASGSFLVISSSHQVAKVLEFQLQHQSFQWIFRTDLL